MMLAVEAAGKGAGDWVRCILSVVVAKVATVSTAAACLCSSQWRRIQAPAGPYRAADRHIPSTHWVHGGGGGGEKGGDLACGPGGKGSAWGFAAAECKFAAGALRQQEHANSRSIRSAARHRNNGRTLAEWNFVIMNGGRPVPL